MTVTRTVRDLEVRLALPAVDTRFGDHEIVDLPDGARKYLRASIATGEPIARAARLAMRGHVKLGTRWVPFRARETLAPHEGFVWAGSAAGLVFGSDRFADGVGMLDWKLLGLVRVAHGDGPDVSRSAAARAAGEAVWLPTALLPRFGVRWEAHDERHLTAAIHIGQLCVNLLLEIDAAGALRCVSFYRWGDPGETGTFGWHRFGLTVTDTATFEGLTVPVAGRVGWHHGTKRWDDGEFFRYRLTSLTPVGPSP